MSNKVIQEVIHTDARDNGKGKVPVSYTSGLERLYGELGFVVTKHSRYLQEAAVMPSIRLPKWYFVAKRSMDIFVGMVVLIILLPFLVILVPLIKFDSRGPVFFSQVRVGKNGKLFKIHKFRTMVSDAESKTGPVWAVDDDPRLTFVGRILRKTKIDELPQSVNLIKGDMSLVGPRPERPFFVDYFKQNIPGYVRRMEVTPGITGPAQLRNGYDRDAAGLIRKLRLDITYIKKMSLPMDLGILMETSRKAFTGKL